LGGSGNFGHGPGAPIVVALCFAQQRQREMKNRRRVCPSLSLWEIKDDSLGVLVQANINQGRSRLLMMRCTWVDFGSLSTRCATCINTELPGLRFVGNEDQILSDCRGTAIWPPRDDA